MDIFKNFKNKRVRKEDVLEVPGFKESKGGGENPYLNANLTWNTVVGGLLNSVRIWQVMALVCLLTSLAAVGGIIHIGSQSKFVPYVIEVDKLGEALAVRPADRAAMVDQRVIRSTIANFIHNARIVTADQDLQTKAIYDAYSFIRTGDPAMQKMNDWFSSSPEGSPFGRAQKITVTVDLTSVMPISAESWQVDWIEKEFDRAGKQTNEFRMRAVVSIYTIETTTETTLQQIMQNPLSVYVRDYSWSKQL